MPMQDNLNIIVHGFHKDCDFKNLSSLQNIHS